MSWSQFCKEPLPDRSFTFWDWFHAVMKLTKEDLRGLWIDRLETRRHLFGLLLLSFHSLFFHFSAILGFVSRQAAEEFLHKSQNGTFLVRFSDSELGGVTVAWITGLDEKKTSQKFLFELAKLFCCFSFASW